MTDIWTMQRLRATRGWIPWVVLAVAMALTAAVTALGAAATNQKDQQRFDVTVKELQQALRDRLETVIALLRAGGGVFDTTGHVDREGFRAFAATVDLAHRYRGVQGIGYAPRVAALERAEFLAEMRGAQGGQPTFRIWPDSRSDIPFPVAYLEPQSPLNMAAMGFDMYSEPVRRAAMAAACDYGTAEATGRVQLVQEISGRKQAGFLIYFPVYHSRRRPSTIAERRANLAGFIYCAFRGDDFMLQMSADPRPGIHLKVYAADGPSPEALLHDSATASGVAQPRRERFHAIAPFRYAGRPWTLAVSSLPAFDARDDRNMVYVLFIVGSAISLLLFLVTRSLAVSQSRTARYAAELHASSDALRQHQAEIEALNERLHRAMTETHHRVKNNLQVITAMLDIRLMDGADTVPASELRRLSAHVRALAAVHELLTHQARDDGEARFISAQKVLEKLVALLQASAGDRTIRCTADDSLLTSRQGTSLALIVNEVVSNALKHGTHAVDIAFTVRQAGDAGSDRPSGLEAELEVCDDGPGFPAGFRPSTDANIGLELVENLSRWDLSGRTEYGLRDDRAGARVTVRFPLTVDETPSAKAAGRFDNAPVLR